MGFVAGHRKEDSSELERNGLIWLNRVNCTINFVLKTLDDTGTRLFQHSICLEDGNVNESQRLCEKKSIIIDGIWNDFLFIR
jgi:hypothetical protein